MNDYPVAVFDVADSYCNTIVLPGMEVVIPLEEDLDCDPLQDDEIRLQALDGSFEQIRKASDPEAKPDHDSGLIHYHFTAVPAGYYRISVRIGETWVDVTADLMVSPKGAYFGGSRLSKDPPPASFQVRREEPRPQSALVEPTSPRWLPRYIDLNDFYREKGD